MEYNAEYFIDKMMEYYNVDTLSALSNIINISQPSISVWKKREYISAIKKKCRELGIYNEIFGVEYKPTSTKDDHVAQNDNDIFSFFKALEAVAVATKKEDLLINDMKLLMKKYIGV